MSTRESRLPGPALLCQPSPHRLARQWECGGRPCSFPELPSGHGDREAVENGSAAAATDPTAGPSSTRPSCTTPRPPATASPAAASTPTTMGLICALLALLARLLAHVIGLWRSSRQRCQPRPRRERGFRHAKQARKEGALGMLMLRHPSRWLARAMAGRSPCQTREIVVRWLLILFSSPQDDAQRPYVEERGSRTSCWQGPVHEL